MDFKEITKEIAISEFKKFCSEDFTKHQRQESVGTNTNRNYWELDLDLIVLSITKDKENVYTLSVYSAFGSILYNNRVRNLINHFDISKEEYLDLKKRYFGDFTIDEYYIKQISNITAKYESIKKFELNEN